MAVKEDALSAVGNNPKQQYGDKKPPLGRLPLAGQIHQSLAHLDGGYKYGFDNWLTNAVEAMTYVNAASRHLELYKCGENHARDTRVHNLGGVMACCAILLDAEINGMLIDDRTPNKAACDLLHNAEEMVTLLKDMQKKRDEAKCPMFIVDAADLRDVDMSDVKKRWPQYVTFVDDVGSGDVEIIAQDEDRPDYTKPPILTCSGCATPNRCRNNGACYDTRG